MKGGSGGHAESHEKSQGDGRRRRDEGASQERPSGTREVYSKAGVCRRPKQKKRGEPNESARGDKETRKRRKSQQLAGEGWSEGEGEGEGEVRLGTARLEVESKGEVGFGRKRKPAGCNRIARRPPQGPRDTGHTHPERGQVWANANSERQGGEDRWAGVQRCVKEVINDGKRAAAVRSLPLAPWADPCVARLNSRASPHQEGLASFFLRICAAGDRGKGCTNAEGLHQPLTTNHGPVALGAGEGDPAGRESSRVASEASRHPLKWPGNHGSQMKDGPTRVVTGLH